MHNILLIYSHFIRLLLIVLPDAPLLMKFRGWCYSLAMPECGKNFQVSGTAILRGLEKIKCGNDVYIGPNAFVSARVSILIESEVLVAMNVVIVDGNHGKDRATNSYRFMRGRQAKIVIRRGAWIAANSVLTAGSDVQAGTIVPPCSVVRGGFI